MARAFIWTAVIDRVQPAEFMLMNPRAANVDGKMYENSLQNCGNADSGHEKPVRNRHTGERKRKSTKTVSLCRIRLLNVRLNATQAAIYSRSRASMSPGRPF